MRSFTRFYAALACCLALMTLGAGQAQAQRGGSGGGGGGGGSTVNTATPLLFNYIASINGATPSCSGDFTLTNSIPGYYTWSTVNISVKAKSLNLPDNTTLTVTIYTSDKVTGEIFAPVQMAPMVVLKQVGTARSATSIFNYTANQIVRQLDWVVVTTADGTVVFSAHP